MVTAKSEGWPLGCELTRLCARPGRSTQFSSVQLFFFFFCDQTFYLKGGPLCSYTQRREPASKGQTALCLKAITTTTTTTTTAAAAAAAAAPPPPPPPPPPSPPPSPPPTTTTNNHKKKTTKKKKKKRWGARGMKEERYDN